MEHSGDIRNPQATLWKTMKILGSPESKWCKIPASREIKSTAYVEVSVSKWIMGSFCKYQQVQTARISQSFSLYFKY